MQLSHESSLHPHHESFSIVSRLQSIANRSQKIFNEDTQKSLQVLLVELQNNQAGLEAAVLARINESSKKQPERLNLIVKSFERYNGESFKDLLLVTSCEQIYFISKKLFELEVNKEDSDSFTESLSLLPNEVRELVITSFLNDKNSNKDNIGFQIASLKQEIINTVGIKVKYDAALLKIARNTALGKKRSGLDHITSVAKHTPFCKILSLLSVLGNQSQLVLDNTNAVSFKKSINILGDFFGKNYPINIGSEKLNLTYLNCLEIITTLFATYPNNHEDILNIITVACDHNKHHSRSDNDSHGLFESLSNLEQKLYLWFEFQDFPNIIYGKSMASLVGELKDLNRALDVMQILKEGRFSDKEVFQIENVLKILSSVPEQRHRQTDVRKISDHLESWVAATVKTLNRNGLQNADFQEWLFDNQSGLTPFLKAYGYRPQAEKLSEIITHLEQFYLCTTKSKEQSLYKIDEASFWMKSGWYCRRVLNVMSLLLRSGGAEGSRRIIEYIDSSAKSFFKIFRESKVISNPKRNSPSQSELDDAEKRYSQAIKSLSRYSTKLDIALSHIAAVLAANSPKDTTFNQYRSLLISLVGKFDRLLECAATSDDRKSINQFFKNEIEKNCSYNNFAPLLSAVENSQIQNAYYAIDLFLLPRAKNKPNTSLSHQDVQDAINCSSLLIDKFGTNSEINQIKNLFKSINSKHDYKQTLSLFSTLLKTYADSKEIKYFIAVLECLDSNKVAPAVVNNNCSKILTFQKSLKVFTPEEVSKILVQVLSTDLIDSREDKAVSEMGSKFSDMHDLHHDCSIISSVINLVDNYQKIFTSIDILEISNYWINSFPSEYAINITQQLSVLFEALNKNSLTDVYSEGLSTIPNLLSVHEIERFTKWISSLSRKNLSEQLNFISQHKSLPAEWIMLKKFGAYSQWQLISLEDLKKSVIRDPNKYIDQIIPVETGKEFLLEVHQTDSAFLPKIDDKSAFTELLEVTLTNPRNKSQKHSSSINGIRSWCAEKIVDYRWKLVSIRDLNDRADLVVELINGLCSFRQKPELKDQIVQAIVKLAPVWSVEQYNKESLASLSKDQLSKILEDFGLAVHDPLIDEILDYAIKITAGKSLAYYHRNRSKFDIDKSQIARIVETFQVASGQNKTRKNVPPEEPVVLQKPAVADINEMLSRAYLTGTPNTADNSTAGTGGFSGPTKDEIFNIQLKRRLEQASQELQKDDSDSLSPTEAYDLIFSNLRLIVSREKRDAEYIATLIKDALPLLLYQVEEKNFPRLVSKFIYQQLPELLDIETDASNSRFGRKPCGLVLSPDILNSEKDLEFLSKLQSILAGKVGIAKFNGEQPSSQKGNNSLTSEIDQKISEIMYSYWINGFNELENVKDILFETLEELKPSSIGYSTVLSSMLGAVLHQEYPHFDRALLQAISISDSSSIMYVRSIGFNFLSKLKKELLESEIYQYEAFNLGAVKIKDALRDIDAISKSIAVSTAGQKTSVNVVVFELTEDIKKEFLDLVESESQTRKQKKNLRNPRVFLVVDKETENPLLVALLYKRSESLITYSVPVLLGKNKKNISNLIRKLSEQ